MNLVKGFIESTKNSNTQVTFRAETLGLNKNKLIGGADTREVGFGGSLV